jgi:DNA-binding MarR family transcriptional regulator
MAARRSGLILRKQSPALFLDLYYPFHYKVGFAIERALRGSRLTQHQAIILWIIHSEGEKGRSMRRKDVEQRITSWFDVTSSAISKALRGMARSEMPFLNIMEDPQSGREKRLYLTDAGQNHIRDMIKRTQSLITAIVDQLTDQEIEAGLLFMRRVSEVMETLE